MALKRKKYYTGALYRDLTHEKAKCLALQNPEFVITRRSWIGYHFIKDGVYYILTMDGIVIDCGECAYDLSEKVYDIDAHDWIVAQRTADGAKLETKFDIVKWEDYV